MIKYRCIPAYRKESYLHQKYVIEGLSTRQIAAENFTSKEVIRTQLIRFNIHLREPNNTGQRNASARFGTRRKHGKLIENMVEARVVKAVVDMHNQGMTLRQIAAFLSQVGVPTKKMGKGWKPETVRRILEIALGSKNEDAASESVVGAFKSGGFICPPGSPYMAGVSQHKGEKT